MDLFTAISLEKKTNDKSRFISHMKIDENK